MSQKRNFSNWLSAYIDYTDNTEPPYLYRLWSGISVLAAAMQRKNWLHWDRTLYPNFYIVLVGRSGLRKGTAMYPAQDLLRNIEVHLASEAVTREALIQELKKTTQADTNPLTGLPMKFSSLTIFSKEFTVFLGYNNNQLIMDLTDWYDCDDRWQYRTKTQGTDDIQGVWVNIFGATTPTQLQTSLPIDAIGGGLSSRMIFVYEEEKGKRVIFPDGINWVEPDEEDVIESLDKQKRENLLDDLMVLKQDRGEFRFDKSFKAAWEEWYNESEDDDRFEGTFLEPYHTRRGTHVLKLCMIMNANRNGQKIITADDLKMSNDILVETEHKMPYTFTGVGRSEDSFVLGKIISILTSKKEMMYSELLSMLINDANHDQTWRCIDSLSRMKSLLTEPLKDGSDIRIIYKGSGKKENQNEQD